MDGPFWYWQFSVVLATPINKSVDHKKATRKAKNTSQLNKVRFIIMQHNLHIFFIQINTAIQKYIPDHGGFQLVDLIITELKDHMTCYRFKCSQPLIAPVYVAVPKQNTEYQYWKHTEV